MTESELQAFREVVYGHYASHGRSFAWRDTRDPYRIWISEIMLQQTQTSRVAIKYEQFLIKFPTVQALAAAPLPELLAEWQGLGYNRRALSMQRAAQRITDEYAGQFPATVEELRDLPGIGAYTAAAVATFAFNRPLAFIETNIRRVFIHHFFPGASEVHDRQLMPLIERAIDREDPRDWYYALMDYGSVLARSHPNPNRRSSHYAKQPAFEGSNRQVRSLILKSLLKDPLQTLSDLVQRVEREPERIEASLGQLAREGFVVEEEGRYRLGSSS